MVCRLSAKKRDWSYYLPLSCSNYYNKSIVLTYNHILMLSILLFYFADTKHLKETFKLELKVDFKITKIVPVPL